MAHTFRRPAVSMFAAVAIVAATITGLTTRVVVAQAPAPTGRLFVTVADMTGAVLPGAQIVVVGEDDRTKPLAIPPSPTSAQGIATIERLTPGLYTIHADFPGFDTGTLANVAIRAGDNRHALVLTLNKIQDTVSITEDKQASAADPKGSSFGTALTREQVSALSDDPTELQQQLQQMAGPGAVIRVDSFEGSALPPKAQIKSIHITRDGFAAENHNPNAFFVDIITQPGIGPLRGGFNLRSRPGALSGRNLVTNTKGPEHTDDVFMNIGGTVVKQRGSFSLFAQRTTSYDTPVLNAVLEDGTRVQGLAARVPLERWNTNALFDYALTRDQTLRVGYFEGRFDNRHVGVGGFELPERAFSTRNSNRGFYAQEVGPVGRRMFLNTRVNMNWAEFVNVSELEAPTIRVVDAFTSGGAQQSGGRRAGSLFVQSDLDYIRGIHSVRTGLLLNWLYYSADSDSNYLGTYTFASLDAYRDALRTGIASNYSRRLGAPLVDYGGPIGGLYIQDDIRISKALTLSPGLRYEDMIHVDNPWNFGPRFGVTWAPFANGRTTIRGSAGIFYDYLSANDWEQTIRVNGTTEQEVNIVNAPYPNPPVLLATTPGNRYMYGDDRSMPRNRRLSLGVDQTFSPKARISLLYTYVHGDRLFRGLNANAPVDGVRPDSSVANVVVAAQDAKTRQHQVTTTLNLSLSSTPLAAFAGGATSGPRIDWKRVSFQSSYTLGRNDNDTDGTFAVPPGSIDQEWGPTGNDIRHRLFVSMTNQTLRNFNAVVNLTATSGAPYSIRTGSDDNGDGIFNDRPEAVGRNTERMPTQWFVNANLVYTIPLGHQPGIAPPGGVGIVPGAPGAAPTVVNAPRPVARYRLQIGVNAQNITNHANYVGYSGVRTSPFFGRPTTVVNPRKIDFTLGLTF